MPTPPKSNPGTTSTAEAVSEPVQTEGDFTLATDPVALAADIANQTRQQLQLDIQQAAEALAQKPKTFMARLRSWLSTQIDRLGNAIIALIAAFIMALVMPLLVNLKLDQELTGVQAAIDSLMANDTSALLFQNTQALDDRAVQLSQQNETLQNQVTELQMSLAALPSELPPPDLSALESRITAYEQQTLNQLSQLQSQLQPQAGASVGTAEAELRVSLSELSAQLRALAQAGESLAGAAATEQQRWLAEVYYFVSFVRLPATELTAVQLEMARIYRGDNGSQGDARIAETLMLLAAMQRWLQVLSPV